MSESIPITTAYEGINECIEKAKKYFVSAKDLISDGKTEEALIIGVYGLEEFGRAVIINDEIKTALDSETDLVIIERRKLRNHIVKQNAVLSILPESLVSLAMGTFNPSSTESFINQRGGALRILQDLRERATYVDFREGSWQSSIAINPGGLQAFVEGVEEETDNFLKYSVSYPEEISNE